MAYTFSRDWYERIECPFCEKGEIEIHRTLPIKKENISTTVGGRRARTGSQTSEREEVTERLPQVRGQTQGHLEEAQRRCHNDTVQHLDPKAG